MLIVMAGTLLRAGLDNAIVASRRINHPAAFPHEQRDGLLHGDIFAGRARHLGHQCVPVVRSAYDDGLEIFVLEHLPEVGIWFSSLTARSYALFKARLVNIAHGCQIHVGLILEIVNVLATDQSEADEPNLSAVVRAENALVGRRGQGCQANGASPCHRIHYVYRNPSVVDGGLTTRRRIPSCPTILLLYPVSCYAPCSCRDLSLNRAFRRGSHTSALAGAGADTTGVAATAAATQSTGSHAEAWSADVDCGLSRVRRGSGIFFAGFADRVCRWSYTVQYEQPIKAPIHRPIKFVIEKDRLMLLDADGKER